MQDSLQHPPQWQRVRVIDLAGKPARASHQSRTRSVRPPPPPHQSQQGSISRLPLGSAPAGWRFSLNSP